MTININLFFLINNGLTDGAESKNDVPSIDNLLSSPGTKTSSCIMLFLEQFRTVPKKINNNGIIAAKKFILLLKYTIMAKIIIIPMKIRQQLHKIATRSDGKG